MTKQPAKLFIRGGQIFLHNVRMFTQVGKLVLLALVIIFVLLAASGFIGLTTAYQRTMGVTYLKAHWMRLTASSPQPQYLISSLGKSYPVYAADIIKSPLFINHITYLKQQLISSVKWALSITFLLLLLIIKWLQRQGAKQSKATILRGSQLVQARELQAMIKKACLASPYVIAGVSLPTGSETQHIQLIGTTGSGKTVAIRELLTMIHARQERAIIYDKGGTYLARFYRPDQDVILNPLDVRGRAWDIWAECEDKADFEALAEALMPMPIGTTLDPFWVNAARMIFVSTAYTLKNHPQRSTTLLLHYLLTADLGRIYQLLRHTESESLVSEKVQKTALNVKTVMATYLKSLLYLPTQGDVFSIRGWIANDQDNTCLYVSSDGRKHPTLRPLISAWINTANKELLGLAPDENRRVWFILDELATLHALPFLDIAKSESRKFGGCFILGYHGASQLRKIYGAEGAAILSNLCSTRLYLRTPENMDAEIASRNIGSYEIEEANESVSYGASSLRDGIAVSRHSKEKRLVLPAELQELDDLHGFLRVKGQFPAARIELIYQAYPVLHDEYMPRVIEPNPMRQQVEQLIEAYHDPLLEASQDDLLAGKVNPPRHTTSPAKASRPPKNTLEFL